MSYAAAPRAARVALAACTIALTFAATPRISAQNGARASEPAPNYELAAAWTAQKVGRLVFDTTVTPRWLEKSDRFWYAFNTREGRRFYFVDPVKKTKAPLFDHAKMAATLTSITRIPYDAQHLPFSSVRFVKDDTAFMFEVQVPRDAVIATPPKKATTTEQGGGGILDDEWDMADAPQQGQQTQQTQQGQRGRGGAPGALRSLRATARCTSSTTWRRAGSRTSMTTRRSRGCRGGRRSRRTARRCSSRATTIST